MKVAFLFHPLTASYVKRAKHWTNFVPLCLIEPICKHIKPKMVGKFSLNGIEACFIAVPLTAKQMKTLPKSFVQKRIQQGVDLAESLGAEYIGLGAFNAIASDQGTALTSSKILTTGRAYTIYAVIEQVKPHLKKGMTLAIVGGDGAIGNVVQKYAKTLKQVNLISITKENHNKIAEADIVVSAASNLSYIINTENLKKNAMVIDAAKPASIKPSSDRSDVKIIPGGIIRVDSLNCDFDFDLGKNQVYACMAEPFILSTLNMKKGFTGNHLDLGRIMVMGQKSRPLGFTIQRS